MSGREFKTKKQKPNKQTKTKPWELWNDLVEFIEMKKKKNLIDDTIID